MKHAVIPAKKSRWWLWVVAGVLSIMLIVTGVLYAGAQRALDNVVEGQGEGKGGNAIDILLAKPLNGEDTGHVNILLAGNSFDDEGHDGATLTDSIMVASMNLTTNKVTLISIPRDLLVEYRGSRMKINAVYSYGSHPGKKSPVTDVLGDSAAGMKELGTVVTKVTGLRIDHYALVGYTALEDSVNAVGGIDVTIESSDPRGIYDPNTGLKLENGVQHIDGWTALCLARARNHPMPGKRPYGIPGGDFDRGKNQRLIVTSLMEKVRKSTTLANPAAVVGLFDTVGKNVRTDLSVSQIRRAYDLSTKSEDLQSTSIRGDENKPLLRDNPENWSLVPTAGSMNFKEIHAYIATVVNS